MKKVTIITDGGATPNPGAGGWGAVLVFEKAIMVGDERTTVKTAAGHVEHATNNEMELTAIYGGLCAIPGSEAYEVLIKTDSQIAIRYLTGLKGKGKQHLLEIADRIREHVKMFGHEVSLIKATDAEVARAHVLAQQEMAKVPAKPVRMVV